MSRAPRTLLRATFALIAMLGSVAFAVDITQLPSEELQARYRELTHDLRCMQCQNQSLADSNVDLAADLRLQVKELLIAGKTNAEIRAYMVERYGNYILFTPPFERSTAWVWIAPILGLIGGVIIAVRIVGSRARMVDEDDSDVTGEESGR